MKKTILRIEGMSCSACSNGLEKYLNSKDGVKATVNLVMATASIEYDDKLTISDLNKYVEEAGFHSLGEEKYFEKQEKSHKTPILLLGVLGLFVFYIMMQHMINIPKIMILDMDMHPKIYAITLFLCTIPFLIFGFDIIKNGIKNIIHKMPNMDSLVTIGIFASFIYSVYSMILLLLGNKDVIHNIFFESTIFVILFVKLGKYLTERSKDKTKDSIKELVKMTPNKAHLKTNDSYVDITIDEVQKGDILVCLSGEKIAVDGVIVKGTSTFDESFITGESIPVEKKEGSKVIAGSINYESKIEYQAEHIGKDSTISEIVRLVVEATNTKAPISKIADIICSYFVPCVLGIAVIVFLLHMILGHSLSDAILYFVTVLVVACPCALGLATPLALVVSVGTSAKKGILIKDSESLELAKKIDTVVFDKTGTLTNGTLTISEINNHCDLEKQTILELVATIEKYSTHPIAVGINKYAKENNINTEREFETEDLPGYGVKAKDNHTIYYVCNRALLKRLDIINSYEDEEERMAKEGNSVIYLVRNNKVLATIGLKDVIRKESKKIVEKLKEKNINVIMLSGDNEITANKIAKELDIDNVVANVNPKDKTIFIKDLIKKGKYVMMVGDGINDAPSLTSATVGVSISSGTDIATSAANIVLVNNNLLKIEELLAISEKTINNIKQNLFWACIYNICMIPIATGLIPGIHINPMIACISMIISSLSVTINALRLKRK